MERNAKGSLGKASSFASGGDQKQEKKKGRESNRLEYKWRGFVVALQDPAKAISGLTDPSGADSQRSLLMVLS